METDAKTQKTTVDNYDFNTSSLMSLGTGVKYEDPRFHLNLIQKKDLPSERPTIDSNKWERLAYYRAFTSTPSKTALIATREVELNSFLWFYAFNVFFKSLPHGFVHFFIAAYAPEEHMFVAKMVPFCHGIKYLFVWVGYLEVLVCTDLIILLFHYTFHGLLEKNPWNRCKSPTYFDPAHNVTVHCYQIGDFSEIFKNSSHRYQEPYYVNAKGEHFTLAQYEYYRSIASTIVGGWDTTIFVLVWFIIQILVWHAWKRYFWKVLHFTQWGINFVDICTFAYLLVVHYQKAGTREGLVRPQTRLLRKHESEEALLASDLEMLAESITAPPVVHVLTSRSIQEIDPTTDSAIMVVSNALIYIFRGLLSHSVKVHCEELVHTEMPVTKFNQHSWFYYWPMFWEEFYLGDLFSVLYFMFNFITEIFIIVVTYLCVVESVVYEWPKIRRWMVLAISFIFGIFVHHFMSIDSRAVLWAYGKGIATLAETVFIYILYPIGRLVDDFTFHYGVPPTRLRIFSIRLVPVYYIFKLYIMFSSLWTVMSTEEVGKEVSHYTWSWTIMLLPILLGMLFTVYKYLVIHRATWNYILRPIPKWGPRDFSVRQLRKQFDSRFYIGSEVPRLLSRYIMSKKESKVYKVDVRYDVQRRSTVSKAVGFGAFSEDKKVKVM